MGGWVNGWMGSFKKNLLGGAGAVILQRIGIYTKTDGEVRILCKLRSRQEKIQVFWQCLTGFFEHSHLITLRGKVTFR